MYVLTTIFVTLVNIIFSLHKILMLYREKPIGYSW